MVSVYKNVKYKYNPSAVAIFSEWAQMNSFLYVMMYLAFCDFFVKHNIF